MRILLVHNRYRIPGGEERHLDLLEEWLPKFGLDVTRFEVASPDHPSKLKRLRMGLALPYSPAGARPLRDVLAQLRPNIVHFHNVFPVLTPAAIREARRYGASVVLTVHNYRFACPAGTLLRNGKIHQDCIEGSSLLCGMRNSRGVLSESLAYGAALELQRRLRLFQRWVDAYVAPSHFVAKILARAGYPANRIHTIAHGVPASATPSLGGTYALYAGRLSPEKGIRTLLEASRLVPDVPIVLAGDGPLRPLVEASVTQGVSYVGHVDQAQAVNLMRGALYTIMPSEWFEVQPYGALESMVEGTPLLASRLGGLAEIIENNVTGRLVPHGNAEALAAAMHAMWAEKAQSKKMGDRARRFALNHFSPTTQSEQLIELYEGLVRGAAVR